MSKLEPSDESIKGGQRPSMGVGLSPLPFDDANEPLPLEESVVIEEIKMPISGQALLWMAVGLLAMGGVVDLEEARELAELEPLSEAEHNELLSVAKWMKATGRAMPVALYRFLFEAK